MRSLVAALLEPVAYPSVYDVTVRAVGDGTMSLAGDQDDLRREGVATSTVTGSRASPCVN